MKVEEVRKEAEIILAEMGRTIVGKAEVMERVLLAILAEGHVLFEDYPGLAKTLMANCFAQTLGLEHKRVQFTPDLLPADITGTYVLDRSSSTFKLRRGPVFTNLLLADEINRAPPKTQAALLEAMQEHQVTLEGETHKLDRPFIVLATQNPIEYEGTYPLPEAQVDRFLIRTPVGYPTPVEEALILMRRKQRGKEEPEVRQVCTPERLMEMQRTVESVHLEDVVQEYIVAIVNATRSHPQVEVGASPRGSLALMKMASARAAVSGRDYVLPDDIKKVAVPALAHRLILAADPWVRGVRPEQVVGTIIQTIPVPKVV